MNIPEKNKTEIKEKEINWIWKFLIGLGTIAFLVAVILSSLAFVKARASGERKKLDLVYFSDGCKEARTTANNDRGNYFRNFKSFQDLKQTDWEWARNHGTIVGSWVERQWDYNYTTETDWNNFKTALLKENRLIAEQRKRAYRHFVDTFGVCFTEGNRKFVLPEVK